MKKERNLKVKLITARTRNLKKRTNKTLIQKWILKTSPKGNNSMRKKMER